MKLPAQAQLTREFTVKRIRSAPNLHSGPTLDTVATEEPLDILVRYSVKQARVSQNLALTMRTPGDDRELAAGFLLSEGIIDSREQIREIRALGIEPCNEILVELAEDVDVDAWRSARDTVLNSSCGICGKRSLESLVRAVPTVPCGTFQIDAHTIHSLPDLLRREQGGFAQTGALHAAALFTPGGTIVRVFEDIGRHNALDKLVGACLLDEDIPLQNYVLFMTSRSSFELVAKAVAAGVPVLATVGGPSSLAIETARAFGITLIGFVRDNRFNIYSGDWRIHS